MSSTTLPSGDMAAFKTTLASAKNIIVVAGAGLSAASGIPTFRGAGGMWRTYDVMSLATLEAFNRNPSRVWQFYHYRREVALASLPNAAHKALAHFSVSDIRHKIAPESTFTLITQNVDGLSTKANTSLSSTSHANQANSNLIEMHGRLFDVLCISSACRHTEFNLNSPICPALFGTEKLVAAGDVAAEPDIPLADLPRCTKCDALARPGVVWFGEIPYRMEEIDKIVDQADLCLVVGTSSMVYPAAGYSYEVAAHGGKVAVFNLDRSEGDDDADYLFLGPCDETLPKAFDME